MLFGAAKHLLEKNSLQSSGVGREGVVEKRAKTFVRIFEGAVVDDRRTSSNGMRLSINFK